MENTEFHVRLSFSKRQLRALLALALLGGLGYALRSVETMRLSTYYPAPAGVYKKIITTYQTILARDGGSVGIGTSVPKGRLHISGLDVFSSYQNTPQGRQAVNLDVQGAGNAMYYLSRNGVGRAYMALGTDDSLKFGIDDGLGVNYNKIHLERNGNVGIATGDFVPQAKLDVVGGIRPGGQTVVTVCSPVTEGTQRYNYAAHRMEFCNGNAWTSTAWRQRTLVTATTKAGGTTSCHNNLPAQTKSANCPAGTTLDFAYLSQSNNVEMGTGGWHYCWCTTTGNTLTTNMCITTTNENAGCTCTAVCLQ